MQLYKLVGGAAIPYGGEAVIVQGKVITRPDAEILRSLGYRPMGKSALPEYNEDTQHPIIIRYEMSEDGQELLPVYAVEELPDVSEESHTPTYEERLSALEQENSQLKEALEMLLSGVTENE